jgi:recombination protein RecA
MPGPVYALALGVDIDSLLFPSGYGVQALEIPRRLRSAQLTSWCRLCRGYGNKAEIEGELGVSHVGVQARLMSQALRKLTGAISKSNCIVIFINQLREKIGVMYGNPETTPGGRALKFYASVRLDVRRIETLKNGTEMIGNRTRVKVVKNKVAPPFKEAEFDIMYGTGISKVGEILDLAVRLEIISRSGTWFNYGDVRLGQGRDNAKTFLNDNPEIAAEVEAKVRENADQLIKYLNGGREENPKKSFCAAGSGGIRPTVNMELKRTINHAHYRL